MQFCSRAVFARASRRCAAIALAVSMLMLSAAADLGSQSLDDVIRAYVERHPTASLSDVAGYAETRRQELGIPYSFMLWGDAPEAVLRGEDRRLRIPVWPEEGPCGERWIGIDALRVQRESIDLVEDGRVIAVRRPQGLDLDVHTILAPDGKTLIAKVEVPWQTTPWRVADNGHAIPCLLPALRDGCRMVGNRAGAASSHYVRVPVSAVVGLVRRKHILRHRPGPLRR